MALQIFGERRSASTLILAQRSPPDVFNRSVQKRVEITFIRHATRAVVRLAPQCTARGAVLGSASVKVRIDKLLLERGLVPTRERAQSLILAGKVLVNEQKVDKAGAAVADDAAIRLLGEDLRYVSRGGLKLEKALQHWEIETGGRTCMDVGTSTGGFTDCLL